MTRFIRRPAERLATVAAVAAAFALVLSGCGQGTGDERQAGGPATTTPPSVGATVSAAPPSTAPGGDGADVDAVVAVLRHRVQMEKASHDLYARFAVTTARPIFRNIADAETAHRQEVVRLLSAYGAQDPSAGLPVGWFASGDVQAFYDHELAEGSGDLDEALGVGEDVEERTIREIRRLLAIPGLPDDVSVVAQNLLTASQRHLRAFAD